MVVVVVVAVDEAVGTLTWVVRRAGTAVMPDAGASMDPLGAASTVRLVPAEKAEEEGEERGLPRHR